MVIRHLPAIAHMGTVTMRSDSQEQFGNCSYNMILPRLWILHLLDPIGVASVADCSNSRKLL